MRKLLKHSLLALLSLFLTGIFVLTIAYTYMELQLPNVELLKDVHMQVPLRIYSADGKLMAQFGAKRRIPVPLAEVPKPLINALLATEDARYYEHPGVDFVGIIRAAVAVITTGRKVQGASTITMQVARNFYLSRQKTYSRKIREILLALKMNKELSKDKILELYLNKVYFGSRAYGVAAAAQVYYGKKLSELTLPQMAMIAGLPQAPSANNPLANPRRALDRRNHVLWRTWKVGFISKAQYEKAITAPITASFHRKVIQLKAAYVSEMVRETMLHEYGNRAYDMGLSVYTTINSTLQKAANLALHDGLIAYDRRHGFRKPTQNLGGYNFTAWQTALTNMPVIDDLYPAAVINVQPQSITALMANGQTVTINWGGLVWARPELSHGLIGAAPQTASDIVSAGDVIHVLQNKKGAWLLAQVPQVQGALVSMDPNNGAIMALVGGFDYKRSNFNRVTMAERQPGSNFKPFIYSAALHKGFTLASMINDAPIVQEDTGENQLWRPTNDTRQFYGPTSVRVGLIKSRNLVSIRLLKAVGVPYALNYIQRFGFDPNTLPNTLSLALGSGTVTPMQIVSGYSIFANGGYRVMPYFIQQIVNQNDKILYSAAPAKACRVCITNTHPDMTQLPQPLAPRVLTPQNAYLMTQAMRDVIKYGTGRAAKRALHRPDLAGKTGTTNKQVDAWFSGFNSNIVTSVWVGFDNMKSLKEYGAQAALPIWIQFMKVALNGTAQSTMPEPPGMVMARVDPQTGLLATPNTPRAHFEVFREQYAPTQYSVRATTSEPPSGNIPAATSQPSSTPNDSNTDSSEDEHLF